VAGTDGCVKKIIQAIDDEIQTKIAAAAAGTDYFTNFFDAHSVTVARESYMLIDPFMEDQYLDVPTAVKYIQQIYDTSVAYPIPGFANILGMDYLRYDKYNSIPWKVLVGTIPPAFMTFAEAEGLQRYTGWQDPATPAMNIRFNHLFATMAGVYINGDNTAGDITGWLGDWQRSGGGDPVALVRNKLGQQTDTTFPMDQLRQDADGYNIATKLRSGALDSFAQGFQAVVQGGYATRIEFFNRRFGTAAKASALCMDYMTATITDPDAWAARTYLVTVGGKCKRPGDIPGSQLQDFCDAFGNQLLLMAQSG